MAPIIATTAAEDDWITADTPVFLPPDREIDPHSRTGSTNRKGI